MFTEGLRELVDVKGEVEGQLQHLVNERVGERPRKGISEFWIWVS